MFCINCGTKLPDEAKFCFNCGTKLEDLLNSINNTPAVQEEEKEILELEKESVEETIEEYGEEIVDENKNIVLTLGNRKIELPPYSKEYACLEQLFDLKMSLAYDVFTGSFNKEHKDLEGMILFAKDKIPTIYEMTINQSSSFLNSFGYNDAVDTFLSYIGGLRSEFMDELASIAENYEEIMMQVEEAEFNRELRKASRGMWQGGGFGIGGAIKGAITAKAMNSVSGAFHSMANSIGNANTKSKAESEFRKFYENKHNIEVLTDKLLRDILRIREALEKSIADVYGVVLPELFTKDKRNQSLDIYEKLINKEYKDEDVYDRILDMLELYPKDEDYYVIAMTYKLDEVEGLKEYAEFFDVSYKAARKEAIENREYNAKLQEKLGDAADIFENLLEDNVYYKELKFRYEKNLVKNIEAAVNLDTISKVSYIYRKVDEQLEKKLFQAFEQYANFENDVPVLYYEEKSNNKKSEGIILTNKAIYFTNKEGAARKVLISDIRSINLDGSKMLINNDSTSIYMMDSGDRALFIHLIWYLVNIIKYSKMSGIQQGAEIPDIVMLREKYYGNGAQVDSNLGEAKTYLENNLARNRKFHSIKGDLTGKLGLDINFILCDLRCDRAWYIYEKVDGSVRTKVDNAISTYANIKGEIPLLIYDGTAFGSAKEGFMITDQAIYTKVFMGNPERIEISSINKISVNSENLFIDGREISFNMIDSDCRVDFGKTVEILLHRLIAEKYCPDDIKTKLKNRLKLNRFFNYEQSKKESFVVNKEKTIQENIIELLKIDCNLLIRNYIFLLSDGEMAIKRYNNAAKVYKPLLSNNERALFLFDNTVGGTGKEGLMITSQGIIFKNFLSKPKKIMLDDINDISFNGTELLVSGVSIFANNIPKHLMNEFSVLIKKVIDIVKEYRE